MSTSLPIFLHDGFMDIVWTFITSKTMITPRWPIIGVTFWEYLIVFIVLCDYIKHFTTYAVRLKKYANCFHNQKYIGKFHQEPTYTTTTMYKILGQ